MKAIIDLSKDLERYSKKLEQKLIQAQRETAEAVMKEAQERVGNGEYSQSIKISETKKENDVISTFIGSDLKSDGHFIGRMIENGTGIYALEPHIGHTKTFFTSGYKYWYVPAKSIKRPIGQLITIGDEEYYVAKAQKPKPHYRPAIEKNWELYKSKIRKAVKP